MSSKTLQSSQLFRHAQQVIPGGVNSPVRAFGAVGGVPRFIAKASGSRMWDEDGNEFVDYIGSWGPMILGHAHPAVAAAIRTALEGGTSFGAPTRREIELAELVLKAYPSCERVRFVSSGTEATMSALRLARGVTNRKYVVKFRGNYHGHSDGLLVQAGSGMLTASGGSSSAEFNASLRSSSAEFNASLRSSKSAPSSAGVPKEFASLTLVADYNVPETLEQLFANFPDQIAAVIFEPVVGNAGLLEPTKEFLKALHQLCKANGTLLIADEVMTGFRLSPGGATQLLKLEPDIVCWGKIIGGGLPVGAYGGSANIMEFIAPSGPVYQAGTLSGNPLAMAAGIATLSELEKNPPYAQLEVYGQKLQTGLELAALDAGVPLTVNRVGSMLTAFFQAGSVTTYSDAVQSNTEAFKLFFNAMLERGVYLPPSQFEAAFFSSKHEQTDLEMTLNAARESLEVVAAGL